MTAALVAVLWWISMAGVSPSQRVADAEPPPPPIVDVAVEMRMLADTVVFRGTVRAAETVGLKAPETGDALPVVVDLPVSRGDTVGPGELVAVISDRPVIVVPTPVPLYRTVLPGMEGADIRRLQEMLTGLGYEIEIDGRFGPESQGAVSEFYQDLGFQAARTGEDLAEVLRSAETAVRNAEIAFADARQLGGTALQRARDELQAAQDARDRAAEQVGATIPLGELVGVDRFPAVVSDLELRTGDLVEDSVLSLTTSELVVDAAVDPVLGSLLIPGLKATAFEDEDWRLEVASNEGTDDQGRSIIRLRAVDDLPPEMLGSDLRIEALLAATEEPVLAVPVTAVRSNAEGEYVRLVGPGDSVREVRVTLGTSIGGWVEIVDADEDVSPGMLVRLSQ